MEVLHQGQILKKIVDYRGLSDEAFGKELGVTRQAVALWYNKNALPAKRLNQIAQVLEVNVSVFYNDFKDAIVHNQNSAPGNEVDHNQIKAMKIQDSEKVELLMMLCDQYQFKIYALQKELQVKDGLLKLKDGINQTG